MGDLGGGPPGKPRPIARAVAAALVGAALLGAAFVGVKIYTR
jgi:hypothetical protein